MRIQYRKIPPLAPSPGPRKADMLSLLTTLSLRDGVQEYVKVEIELAAPEDSGDSVWISGSIRELGRFEAKGVKLSRVEPGRYRGSFFTSHRGPVEYKYNLGNWNRVEKGPGNTEILENRVFTLEGAPLVLRDRVHHWQGSARSTVTGDFQIFFDFKSRYLEKSRNIYVWLPPEYKASRSIKYPLLLGQDGQNLFDASTSYLGVEWELDETAQALIARMEIEPMIIVGVANTEERIHEYTPFGETAGGGGAIDYGRFVIEELLPFLVKRFKVDTRSPKNCALGASVGALAALHLFTRYPRLFGACAALSPATWFAKGSLAAWVEATDFHPAGRLWIDVGTEEGVADATGVPDAVKQMRRIRKSLEKKGLVPGKTLFYHEEPGAEHNELAWQRRMPRVLKALFGKTFANLKDVMS